MVSAVLSSADSQVKPSHPSSCCHRAGCSKYRALAVWKKCCSCRFGGSGLGDLTSLRTANTPCHGQEQSLVIDLPPMAVMVYRCTHRFPVRRKKDSKKEPISESEVN